MKQLDTRVRAPAPCPRGHALPASSICVSGIAFPELRLTTRSSPSKIRTCVHVSLHNVSTPSIQARTVSTDGVDQAAGLFRLMGDPTRLTIILSCLDGPASVGDIAASLDISASLVSHHLRLLRAARVLRAERRGRQIFYSPLDQHIQCVSMVQELL